MSVPDPVTKVRKARFITREMVLWSTAALFATGYLLTLGLAPEVLEDLTPATVADPQTNEGQRAAARVAADVKALRDSVAQVQLDLAKVKTEVARSRDTCPPVGATCRPGAGRGTRSATEIRAPRDSQDGSSARSTAHIGRSGIAAQHQRATQGDQRPGQRTDAVA